MRTSSSTHPKVTSASRRHRALVLVVTALAAVGTIAGTGGSLSPVVEAAAPANSDWLGIVNTYRAQSGLAPVSENIWWSAGARNHSCWMMLNGIAHDEAPGTPGYTTEGDQAGNASNVAVSSNPNSSARSHIDLWMSGPFHAIGILRSSLTQTGFGLCSSPPNPSTTSWKSAGTLDVVRGNNWGAPKPASPVVFPGNGVTTSLTRFVAESPDPRSFCGWGAQSVGLPLIALMPAGVSTANASLVGPDGPIPTCVLHAGNTNGVASSILGGDNAVVVIPSAPLRTGSYSVSVGSNGGNAAWSFNVDPYAPLIVPGPPPETSKTLAPNARFQPVTPFRFADSRINQTITRLTARQPLRIKVAGTRGIPSDATAVSASFKVVAPAGPGFLTAYNCGTLPTVSTLNYEPGETVSNEAITPLDGGDLCLYVLQNTDVVIDVNGYVASSGSYTFEPVTPKRVLDTRVSGRLPAYTRMAVDMTRGNSPVPPTATAVAVNVTGILPDTDGWIKAFPCDVPEPAASTVNARAGRPIANGTIVPLAADGTLCLIAMTGTDVVIDVTGWFGPATGLEFTPVAPIRLADTRSYDSVMNPLTHGQMLPAGQVLEINVAGVRGLPSDITAVTLNLTGVDSVQQGWIRVVPCGSGSDVSTLNHSTPSAVANGTNVKLGPAGTVCVVGMATGHVIVDVTGVWR
jgi:uncharacterized protein YkwD